MGGKRGKNDADDAAAICEAVTRPNASRSSSQCQDDGLCPVPPQVEQLRSPVPRQLAHEDHLASSLLELFWGCPVPPQPWQVTFPEPLHLVQV